MSNLLAYLVALIVVLMALPYIELPRPGNLIVALLIILFTVVLVVFGGRLALT